MNFRGTSIRTPFTVHTRHRSPAVSWLSGVAVAVLIAAGLVASPTGAEAAGTQEEFYLSPTGNDSNDGSSPSEAFATLDRARTAVRTIAGNMTGDIIVHVAPGTYHVTETVRFDEDDSGTNGYSVIYRGSGAPGEAEFVGGTEVTSAWTLASHSSSNPGEADLPAGAVGKVYRTQLGPGLDVNTLYVGDARATQARTPNRNIDPRFPTAQTDYLVSSGGSYTGLGFAAGSIDAVSLAGLENAYTRGDLNAQVYAWDGPAKDWMTSTIPIGQFDRAGRIIHFLQVAGHPELNRPHYAYTANVRYFIQGNLGLLDQPGEFYYNEASGFLYYYPEAGSGPIADQEIVVPRVEKIIELAGESRTNMVSDIVFDGLRLEATSFPDYYTFGWNSRNGQQGAWSGMGMFPPEATVAGSVLPSHAEISERPEFQVGGFTLTNTNHITITNSHIRNMGMFGVALNLANDHTLIEDSLIEYMGHSGVNIEGGYPGVNGDSNGNGYSNNNTVTNTIIHDVGQLVGSASGVVINNATSNTLSHLEIYNSPRHAIFLTGGGVQRPEWSTTAAPNGDRDYVTMNHMYAHHNTISHVYVHGLEHDSGDDGGIFTFELYKGTTHRPNYIDQVIIDDVGANPTMDDYAVNGMNLDVGASGVQVSNFQAINPQNFNVEVSGMGQFGDQITFTNTNASFGKLLDQTDTFDPALMDYANIGVDSDNPYKPAADPVPTSPSNTYFEDDFEGAEVDATKWRWTGQRPTHSRLFASEGVRHLEAGLEVGHSALYVSDAPPTGSRPVLHRTFDEPLSKIVTMQMFDRQSTHLAAYTSGVPRPNTVRSFARVDNGGAAALGLGIDSAASPKFFVLQEGTTVVPTTVPRAYGWHELKWDYSSGSDVKLYIDGVLVATRPATSFTRIQLGNADIAGEGIFDELYVHGGSGTGTAPPLPALIDAHGKIEAESRTAQSGTQVVSGGTGSAVGHIDSGTWLKYGDLDFGDTGLAGLTLSIATTNTGKKIDIRLDAVNGPVIGTLTTASTGGYQTYAIQTVSIARTTGTHDVYLVPTGSGSGFANIDWFSFGNPATATIEAESWTSRSGTQVVSGGTGSAVGYINSGTWLGYADVEFGGTGLTGLRLSVATPESGKKIDIRLDAVNGPVIGTLTTAATGGYYTYATQTVPITPTTGTHDVYLVAAGGDGIANIDWFSFF